MKIKNFLYTFLLIATAAASTPAMAEELAEEDSLKYPRYDNAFDYLLQKPLKMEKFENKKPGDHLFIMTGGGVNLVESQNRPGYFATMKLGDWITPVHGVRIGGTAGFFDIGKRVPFVSAELDYLMNLSTLGTGRFSWTRPAELALVVGGDFTYARKNGTDGTGFGIHAGLLGTVRLSNMTFVFAEPRIGISQDDPLIGSGHTWRGYRPTGSITVGMGYKLLSGDYRHHDVWDNNGLPDNVFLSVGLGAGAQVVKPLPTVKDNIGMIGAMAIGKQFSKYSALRLKGKLGLYKTEQETKVKMAQGQLDYLFNLTNLFGGYKQGRTYWLNGVIGADAAFTKTKAETWSLGAGAGVQMNVRVGRYTTLYLEPRMDIYPDKYNPLSTTARRKDVVGSVELGLTFMRNDASNEKKFGEASLHRQSFWDNLFIQGSAGFSAVATRQVKNHLKDLMSPTAAVAVGTWLDKYSGLRVYGEGRKLYRSYNDNGVKMVTGGIDYMWNLSNFIAGYDPDRVFEVSATIGPRLGVRARSQRIYPGASASLQALVHVNKLTALFVEPAIQTFQYDLLGGGVKFRGMGFTGSVMAGLQFTMRGYDSKAANSQFREDDKALRSFTFIVGGPSNNVKRLKTLNTDIRFGYGRWYNAAMAWRAGAEIETKTRFTRLAVNADWLLSLSTLTYGYNPDRFLGVNFIAGVGLANKNEYEKNQFNPDIHAGGQLTFRVNRDLHLLIEPQASIRLLTNKGGGKPFEGAMSISGGLAYNF